MKYFQRFICIMLFAAIAGIANANIAWPGLLTYTQPDGSVLEYKIQGDEYCHAFFTTDGVMITESDNQMCYASRNSEGRIVSTGMLAHNAERRTPAEKATVATLMANTDFSAIYKSVKKARPKKLINIDNFPTIGELHGLILLVNFNDVQMREEHTNDVFSRRMNEEGCTVFDCQGSARDYFVDQSFGQFLPTFDVVGPIDLDESYSYYGQNDWYENDMNAYQMIVEACTKAHDDFNVDFSKYDYDKDGYVDFVYVIYAGYAESYGASKFTIWPHASNLSNFDANITLDGKIVDRYACSQELKNTSGDTMEGIGTFCHEFGHVLGLADVYNVARTTDVQLGQWDVMDQGNYNNDSKTPCGYSGYERASLRWMQYTDLEEPARRLELPELSKNKFIYRIKTHKDNEFFVLENRQQTGWDAYLPGHGMLVFHIDFYHDLWVKNQVNCNSFPLYDLVEASGFQGYNSPGDPFPGFYNITTLADYTYPSMMLHDGLPADRGLTHIAETGDLITFDFRHDRLKTPQVTGPSNITSHSFDLAWNEVFDAITYRVNLTEVYPEGEKIEAFDEDFALMKLGEYPNSDYDDTGKVLDYYTHVPGWTGLNVYQCGGWAKVGSYNLSGTLTTPAVEAAEALTVVVAARGYTGKTTPFTISLLDPETGEAYDSKSFTCKKAQQDFIVHFEAVKEGSKVSIATDNERLFVDRIRVLYGNVPDDEVWTHGLTKFVFDNIETTQYTVDGLKAERTYTVNVQALCDEEELTSLPTEEFTVTTLEKTGVDMNGAEEAALLISGRTISLVNGNGKDLLRIYRADGTTAAATATSATLAPGIYIARYKSTVKKLFIR